MRASIVAERVWLAVCAGVAVAILGFYAGRLGMPLPIFAGDEGAYLIRALYTDDVVAKYPGVAFLTNGVHLSVIRAIYELGAPVIVGDRLVNAAAYLGGLLLLWRTAAGRLPRTEQLALLLIAIGYPFYRFAFSNMAEGLFVGVLLLLCLATGRWYRSRPFVHAVLGGALAAALVLIKPHGLVTVAALALVAAADAAASRHWRRLPVRVLLFAAAFFVVGNLIQIGADEPAAHPLAFFLDGLYDQQLAQQMPPNVLHLGLLAFGAMVSATALLAGAPILVGLLDLLGRWRGAGRRFEAEGLDLVFLLLTVSLAGALAMAAVFSMKVAWTPSETYRLWGRYFEFFVPTIWLAAGPALARRIGWRLAWTCAAVMLAGLGGLLLSLRAGIVLFPWDSDALLAFFQPDPVRAPLNLAIPYRAIATGIAVLAAVALALRVRPIHVGLGLVLGLGAVSSHLDHVWVGGVVNERNALERDIRSVLPRLPPQPADILLLTPDANIGHLVFLRLEARPRVFLGAVADAPVAAVATARAVLVSGPETPPAGPWERTFHGQELSLYEPPRPPKPTR